MYEIPLVGDHQIHNAITAYASVMELRKMGYEIDDSAIKQGFSNVKWTGRFDIVKPNPLIIIDGAHNRESFRMLRNTIKKYLPEKRIVLIFGVSEDKEVEYMLKIIRPFVHEFIFTKSDHPRALGLRELEQLAEKMGINNYSIQEIDDLIPRILEKQNRGTAYIASGSIFIAGAVKQLLSDIRI